MRKFVGPILLAVILMGEGWHVTAAVTEQPWTPIAGLVGTTKAIRFADPLPTKKACEAYIKTPAFLKTYLSLAGFLTSHAGAHVTPPMCIQLPDITPQVPEGEPV